MNRLMKTDRFHNIRRRIIIFITLVLVAITNPVWAIDTDSDGADDNMDNCPTIANADQTDTNIDGIGDACTMYHCVTNGDELKQALAVAETNNMYDYIMIEQGKYTAAADTYAIFHYNYKMYPYPSESYGISLAGGYKGFCSRRELNPQNTVLFDEKMSSVILSIASGGLKDSPVSRVTVEGLTLKSGYRGIDIYSAGEISIFHNIVSDNKAEKSGCAGGYIGSNSSIALSRNMILRNQAYHNGGGLCLEGSNILLYRNAITDNSINNTLAPGYYAGDTFGGGVSLEAYGDAKLINNVIANNSNSTFNIASGGGVDASAKNLYIINNTITGNTANNTGMGGGIYYKIANGGIANFYNNVIWGNTSSYYGGDIAADTGIVDGATNLFNNDFDPSKAVIRAFSNKGNNFNVNPIFVNSANRDYHLAYTSPVIDTGSNSAPCLPLEDFEGAPRITKNITDIGADEFNPVAVSFSANPVKGLLPLAVNFTDQSGSGQGTITSWAWDFNNDGVIDSTVRNPSYTYRDAGLYTVRLTVTDSKGYANTGAKEDYIEAGNTMDSDRDGISDVLDNCRETYNPLQTDLDKDGTGDICDNNVDLLAYAGYTKGLKSATAKEVSASDVTAPMKDGKLDAGMQVALSSGKYNILSFRSNAEASGLNTMVLNLYVTSLYKGLPLKTRIYAYGADGLSIQSTRYLDFTLYTGWNSLNLTPLLHLMDGFGFIKFRVTSVKNWAEISEAYFTETIDDKEIAVSPSQLDFGHIAVGTSKTLNLTVSNTGSSNIKILNVIPPSAPFSITSDGCKGVTLSPSATCSITTGFTQTTVRPFLDELRILSNDSDKPSVIIKLTAVPQHADLTGVVSSALSNYPLGDAKVTVTDPVGASITLTCNGIFSSCSYGIGGYSFRNLTSGDFTATFELAGYAKKTVSGALKAGQNTLDVQLTPVPPLLLYFLYPQNDEVLNSSSITVNGNFSNNTQVTEVKVNGFNASITENNFSAPMNLVEGQNVITATAKDQYGQTATQSITVTLVTKGSVTGTVTDSSTGAPIPSATVSLTDAADTAHTALTDSNGRYAIADIAPGAFTGTATKDRFVQYDFFGSISSSLTTLDIQLTPDSTLTGRVTDSTDNAPISDADVTFYSDAQTLTTKTGQDGSYTIANILPGNFTLNCIKPGYFQMTANSSVSAGETKSMDVQLTPMPSLALAITSPLDGAVVNSSWLTVSGTVSNNANVSVNGTQASTTDGLFSAIIPLKEGVNTITASARDAYGQTASQSIVVTLTGLLDKEEIFIEPFTADFGDVKVGGSKSKEIRISNIGSANLTIGILNTASPFMILSDNCSGKRLYPATSCSVVVKFVPILSGEFTGTLKIPSGDADHQLVSVPLTGTGDLSLGGYFLPDTGQTDCYNSSGDLVACSPSLGQDGSYTINPLSYIEDNPLTVTDKNTGLEWQRQDNGTARTWTNAMNYCDNLTLDGNTDWRLPTYFELLTIVDYGKSNPALDTVVFPGAKSTYYWSSTIAGAEANVINFKYGTSSTLGQSSLNNVRCVRGAVLPDGFFSDNDDDTLTDWDTGLMWTKAFFSVRTWSQALYFCSMIEIGGYTDWRLPDIKELLSKTYTDCYFGDCAAWSSTTFQEPDAEGYYKQAYIYDNAEIAPHEKTETHMFRCVRGGWGTIKGNVQGTVTDSLTGMSMSSANIILTDSSNNSLSALTDVSGKYAIADVAPGDFTLTISKAGYASKTLLNTVSRGQTVVINASLTPIANFAVTPVGEYGNVTVMEVTGNYDARKPDGSINSLPRQEIAKEFLKTHPDNYDFFVIFTNFDFAMPDPGAKAFYLEVKNDTHGIGKTLFDNSALFGSSKLQGTIDMGNITTITVNPSDPKFEETISLLAHEQMHRWAANVKYKDSGGNTSSALLGKDGTHWSFLLDSDGSVMYGNDWKSNDNGTFTSTGAMKYYSPLDLYLMGMYDKTKVPAMLLVENASVDPTRLPSVGETISGTARTVTIDDIIAAEGQRVPDAAASQKTFRVGFILITRPNTYTGNEPAGIENIRNAYAGRFANLTYGKGSIADVTPSITIAISSTSDGATVTGPDVTVRGSIINSTGNETGVTVNGMIATVYGNQFIANHVPLVDGVNTVTITATDTAGNTTTTSITVNAVTTGNYIRLTSNIESGIAPLEVVLRIDGSFSVTSSSLTATGPVQPQITSSTPDEYTVKMAAEGIYYLTATTTGPDRLTYEDTIGIIVLNRNQMDNLLKGKWAGMKSNLINQDIEGAANYFSSASKEKYSGVFTTLQQHLPEIASNMAEIKMDYVTGDVAEYRISRMEDIDGQMKEITYFIYFIKDGEGIWKIESM